MQAVTIRAAILTDLPHLTRLWHEKMVLHQQFDSRFRLAADGNAQWSAAAERWLDDPNCRILAAARDDLLVGYIIGWLKSAPPGLVPVRIGCVSDLAIDAHSHSGGLGRLLFATLHEWFIEHSIENIVAQVPHRGTVEQAFWRARGATEWMDLMWIK